MITNPPYGERITAENMEDLYALIGSKLKNIFKGYHAWIIAAKNEFVNKIGLAPSEKIPILNGSIECELREYIIFEGDYKSFRREGNRLREIDDKKAEKRADRKKEFGKARRDFRRDGASRKGERYFSDKRRERREYKAKEPRNKLEERYRPGGKSFGKFASGRDDRRDDRDRRDNRRDERPGGFRKFRDDRNEAPQKRSFPTQRQEPSENPFAARRSEEALRSITGKQPSLPPMRRRKEK